MTNLNTILVEYCIVTGGQTYEISLSQDGTVRFDYHDALPDKRRFTEGRIEPSQVESLAERLMKAMSDQEESINGKNGEPRVSIKVRYQGRDKKIEWVSGPPDYPTPDALKELEPELTAIMHRFNRW